MHTSNSPAELAQLGRALERVASWVRRAAPRGAYDIVAMSTLDAVATEGPMRVSALAVRERISQPGMTGVVDRLADGGLVTRRADPRDGRVALIEATDAGRTHLYERHAARATALAEHIDRLTAGQQQALLAAVDGLNALTTPQQQATAAADPKGHPA